MADDDKKTPPKSDAPVADVAHGLSVRSVNVVIDSVNKSPNGLPLEIVELAFWPHNQGNGTWMQWADMARFRCERGKHAELLKALGLEPSE